MFKQVRLFLNEQSSLPMDKPSTNPSTPGVTRTPPHPKYQTNDIDNNQIIMSKFDLTES